jgi:hypothetical protein
MEIKHNDNTKKIPKNKQTEQSLEADTVAIFKALLTI